jgi:hypothetical protein
VKYEAAAASATAPSPRQLEVLKLHEAVGRAILAHKYGLTGLEQLPTVADRFEWSLGQGARSLAELSGANCAIFLYLRDGFPSMARVGVTLLASALGSAMTLPQTGFASLVDLRTGEVLWFDVLYEQRAIIREGDPRSPTGAESLVSTLLSGLPL